MSLAIICTTVMFHTVVFRKDLALIAIKQCGYRTLFVKIANADIFDQPWFEKISANKNNR